ncbi:ribosome assembly RNA-binding protein YhbY [Catellicoccus marimammalium]|uniref:RNA binding protein n=1 Tax=Catellicoccus marimammalium M35/04/3 TaxID=1234409 RepID=K8Z931_9ENTE|nr:ribosome assembly RNA-binding protein YhbY [Catellicoccus marimammalium]EKU27395.1 RNA binding protein [Catellicoccus marimammalium M35/04/3]
MLRGKQKRYLRSQAHHMQPIFQIGKNGVSPELLQQVDDALEKRELFKVSLLQNTDEIAEDVAEIFEEELGAQVVQIIGRILVVYRPSSKEKNQRYSTEVNRI